MRWAVGIWAYAMITSISNDERTDATKETKEENSSWKDSYEKPQTKKNTTKREGEIQCNF